MYCWYLAGPFLRMSWKVWIVASGIANSARVTNRNNVDCRLVISACKSEPMMKSYISSALLVSRSRSSGEREASRSRCMSKRLTAIGYSMSAASRMQSLPSSGWPGAKSFKLQSSSTSWRWLSRMTIEHSPRAARSKSLAMKYCRAVVLPAPVPATIQ